MTTTAETAADAERSEMTAESDASDSEAGRKSRLRGLLAGRDPLAWLVGGLTLVFGCVFVGMVLAYNQGNLVAPLDDVYIHLQYGKQLAEGHFFQYNTGDPISTGASSILYSFILATAYVVGFKGGLFLGFAVAFGVLCMAATAGVTYHLGRLLVSRAVGVWSGLFVALSGPLMWGAASGMEVGITSLLVTGTLWAFVHERPGGRFVRTPIAGFFLALVRPEGLLIAIVLCGLMLWTGRRGSGERRTGIGQRLFMLLPLLAAACQYLFYRIATGTFSANGVQAKSLLDDEPVVFFGGFVDSVTANIRGVVGFLGGTTNQNYTYPAAIAFFVLGIAYLCARRREWRPLAIALAVAFVGVIGSVSTLNTALIHELRYYHPILPVFFLVSVIGVFAVTRVVRSARLRAVGMHSLLVIAILFSVIALPTWAVRIGRESATIRDTDVSIGSWIDKNLPPDAVVGVKDVGAIAYFGHRRVIDTVGLATNGLAEASNNGSGSLYEALRQLPPGQRPTHFAVYEPRPGAPMQPFIDAGIFRAPLATFHVRSPYDLDHRRIVPFEENEVYPADWTRAGSGDAAPVPGDVRDYLNTGSLDSEAAHGYEARMEQPGLQPYTVLRRQGDVIDSGRIIVGGETFTANNLRAGEPLTISSRVLAQGYRKSVRVVVDGKDVGTWKFSSKPNQWVTEKFRVPGDAITSPSATIELKPTVPLMNPYPEYTSFGYWFTQ